MHCARRKSEVQLSIAGMAPETDWPGPPPPNCDAAHGASAHPKHQHPSFALDLHGSHGDVQPRAALQTHGGWTLCCIQSVQHAAA